MRFLQVIIIQPCIYHLSLSLFQYIEGTKTIRPLTYIWFVSVFTYAISDSFSIFLSVSFISI